MKKYKQIFRSRKGNKGNKYRYYPVRGSRNFHDPADPKIDMFPDPGENGPHRGEIGRYGGKGKQFPLVLLRAAHFVANELFYNPLNYVLTRRLGEDDSKPRKVYSQRREALAKLASTMIMRYSIGYGMVGKVDKHGEFQHISLADLASYSGLSYDRAKRALEVLRRKGAVKTSRIVEKNDDGSYSSRISVKHLTRGFWEMFGFFSWIKKEREKLYKKRKKGGESQQYEAPASMREQAMGEMVAAAVGERVIKEALAGLNAS